MSAETFAITNSDCSDFKPSPSGLAKLAPNIAREVVWKTISFYRSNILMVLQLHRPTVLSHKKAENLFNCEIFLISGSKDSC